MWRLDEGIRWQKAPRQFAGRGLAYWTGRRNGARARGHAGLPHGVARCEDRLPDPEFGKNGVVDLMEGSASRSCRSRWTTPAR